MKGKRFFLICATLALIAVGSRGDLHAMDMNRAIRDARSAADYDALARYYEDAAAEMDARVGEHEALLQQYDAYAHRYGHQASSLRMNCSALIDAYRLAADLNRNMARSLRQLTATQ